MANRILELALNRTGKSTDDKSAPLNQVEPQVKTERVTKSPQAVAKQMSATRDNINMLDGILKENQEATSLAKRLSPNEVERTKQMLQKDISQYNNDINLLSLLVGRPINSEDLTKLANTNLGKPSIRTTTQYNIPEVRITTARTTQAAPISSTIPAFKALTERETKFLEALEQIQTTKIQTTTSTTERSRSVSQSQEAIIAAILRQQGIGPNNQIPIEVRMGHF